MKPLLKPLLALVAASLVTFSGKAAPPDRITRSSVTEVRPLMIEALQAPGGQAHGVLTGLNADAITQHFKAASPIYIDVSTLLRYAQAGCARLTVTFWQEGVQLPSATEAAKAAKPRRQTIEFGINYCLDGRPPQSLAPERP